MRCGAVEDEKEGRTQTHGGWIASIQPPFSACLGPAPFPTMGHKGILTSTTMGLEPLMVKGTGKIRPWTGLEPLMVKI